MKMKGRSVSTTLSQGPSVTARAADLLKNVRRNQRTLPAHEPAYDREGILETFPPPPGAFRALLFLKTADEGVGIQRFFALLGCTRRAAFRAD